MTVEEANIIQAEWMALQCDAPEPEKKRVFRLMEKLPSSYIAVNSKFGTGQIMVHNQPAHARPEPIVEAVSRAKIMKIQTTLRWNCAGRWEEVLAD